MSFFKRLSTLATGYPLDHLRGYGEYVSGPIQSDEALLLFALTRVLRPRVVVEFGFYAGQSARNFLRALTPDGVLYSYDPDPRTRKAAAGIKDPRFCFVAKASQDFRPEDIGNQSIDVLFIDGAHDLQINLLTFERILGSLKESAIIVIHDTGTWNRGLIQDNHKRWRQHMENMRKRRPEADVSSHEFAHQPDERHFVNELKKRYPSYEQIHFHSLRTIRHGMTLLQKRSQLKI